MSTLAYAITADNGATSEVVCTSRTCAETDASGENYDSAVPLDQSDLDTMARTEGAPVVCDRCGLVLAEVPPAPESLTLPKGRKRP